MLILVSQELNYPLCFWQTFDRSWILKWFKTFISFRKSISVEVQTHSTKSYEMTQMSHQLYKRLSKWPISDTIRIR